MRSKNPSRKHGHFVGPAQGPVPEKFNGVEFRRCLPPARPSITIHDSECERYKLGSADCRCEKRTGIKVEEGDLRILEGESVNDMLNRLVKETDERVKRIAARQDGVQILGPM